MNQSTKLLQKFKRLRATTFSIAKLEWGATGKSPFLKGNKNDFAF